VKLVPLLKGVLFSSLDYRALTIPKDSIVYCDPPYAGTSGYDGMPFDHSIFWAWVRNISMYHRVYVSEYVAPKDFISVWSHERKDNIDAYRSKGLKVREHLFIWKRGKAFETL
jgi:DNA adenine methylase